MIIRTPRIRILLWTRRSRDTIREKLGELLTDVAEEHTKNLVVVFDELAKNAIKANHKHLIMRRRMLDTLRREQGLNHREALARVTEICASTEHLNEYLDGNPEITGGLTQALSSILRQEATWINIRNKKHAGETLSDEDREKLSHTEDFRRIYREVQGKRVFVEFRGTRNGNQLWIEVVNAAPIMRRDLERIEEKRRQFKEHRDAGTEYEFFLTAMDNSDGGSGLGYATIDTHLSNLGVDPLEALRIISVHSTNVMLSLDLAALPKDV